MSLIDYHKITSEKLLALTNKVRNLISHWGEDGRYKEADLKNVIGRFLPEKCTIGTGFVIKQTATRGEHLSSRQLDLVIYDNASPVLFKEGNFVTLTSDAVRGTIEVKANLQNQELTNVLRQANVNGKFIFEGKDNKKQKFFNVVFSYDGYTNNFDIDTFMLNYKNSNTAFIDDPDYKKFKVTHVSLNKDWVVKTWNTDKSTFNIQHPRLIICVLYFHLIDTLSNKSVKKNSFIWYASDKELNRVRQF